MNSFDSRELRRTLGAFTTGVTVVTTVDATGRRHGVTANSFSSVSLEPPLILWSQSLNSRSYPVFRDGERFVVNIMAHDQAHVSNQFAKAAEDKFAGIATSKGIGGMPIIEGSAAHLECIKVATWPGGDHVVYLGRVEKIHRAPRKALAYGEGGYMVTFAQELGGAVASEDACGCSATIEAVRLASAAMPEICEQVGQHTVCLGAWGNHGPTIVRWEPSDRPVSRQLQTGVVVSLTQSATGLAFAAFYDRDTIQPELDRELAADAGMGGLKIGVLLGQLAEARLRGLARTIGATPSERHQATVNALSAPIFNAKGDMVLALTVMNRADLLDPDWSGPVATALRAAAGQLSWRLGCNRKPRFN
jgi:flavin reductase (DIM6/NTAB) family NADH-FMN oxidoreductase RutF/DNA-binding IclR family transcriptional regulator